MPRGEKSSYTDKQKRQAEHVSLVLPRPEPLFLPPWSCLLTVAQARRSASSSCMPRCS